MAIQAQSKRPKGGLGFFDDGIEGIERVLETISGTGGFVNKTPEEQKMEQLNSMPEHKAGSVLLGEFSNFQTARFKGERIEAAVTEEHRAVEAAVPLEIKKEEIATLNGLQANFEGVMNSSGEVYEYYNANAEEKRAETLAQKLQQERKAKLASKAAAGKGGGLGENELLMGGERSGGGHWTTSVN